MKAWNSVAAVAALALLAAGQARAGPPPVEAYGHLPQVEMVRISPAGDKIAFVTVTGADRKLHVTDIDGNTLHDVDCSDIKLRGLDWADDDHVLLSASVAMKVAGYTSQTAGEYLEVVTLDPTSHRLSVVFNGDPELLPLVFGDFGSTAVGGHAYGYFAGIRRNDLRYAGNGFPNLYRVDLDSHAHYALALGRFAAQSWLIDPSTGELAATAYSDERAGEWRIEVNDQVLERGRSGFGQPRFLGFGRQPHELLVAEPTDGADRIREIRTDGPGATDVEGGDQMVDFLLDPRTGRWIGVTREGDMRPTEFFDPAKEALWRAALSAVHDDHATLASYSNDLTKMIVETEGDADSGTWWLLDTKSGAAKRVGQAYPDIPADAVGSVSMVDWKASDGLALSGVLTLPPGRPAHGLPLVVLPHGGPQERDYAHFDWLSQAFAGRGYAVFQPNFRGSDGYGLAFVAAAYGQWGRKMQTDISDGVAELARRGVVDPKRACIVGGSYGGYAALAGVTVQQGLYRCAVAWGGVSDLPLMLQETSNASGGGQSYALRYWRRFMGADGPDRRGLDSVSPARLASRADAPILIMYGRDDSVVPPIQSQSMADALKKAGKPFEVQAMAGEDHWLSRGATRTEMLRAAVAYVQKYNPPD